MDVCLLDDTLNDVQMFVHDLFNFVTSPELTFDRITVKLNFVTRRHVGVRCVREPSAKSASLAKLCLHLREFHGEELTLRPNVERRCW